MLSPVLPPLRRPALLIRKQEFISQMLVLTWPLSLVLLLLLPIQQMMGRKCRPRSLSPTELVLLLLLLSTVREATQLVSLLRTVPTLIVILAPILQLILTRPNEY